mmetsp:Transcript_766/g.1676  ORF Transcript_766/g.1676 Transcript_766/m.1676 type:complete len:342 (-) Transcript_766:246-1271(-)
MTCMNERFHTIATLTPCRPIMLASIRLLHVSALLVIHLCTLLACAFEATTTTVGRRAAIAETVKVGSGVASLSIFGTPSTASAAKSNTPIADRLDATALKLPPPSMGSELNGVDNLFYPKWLAGEWDVVQTLRRAETPLGLKFVGGPGGSEEIAAKSMEEQRRQIDVPVNLRLRWVDTNFGVAEDRLFNTKSRLDSFAGRSVVASVEYANVGGSNRASVLALGGTEEDPLQTTVTRFKGPAAQKVFVVAHGEEYDPDSKDKWAGHEVLRSIFALTNQNTAPPVTTDTESIWYFERIDDSNIRARLRIASYLNAQSDTLYFEAKNRAVSFADYDLVLKKVPA